VTVDDSKCGDTTWRVAGNLMKKTKNLYETGLEILGCRHGLAQASINMFYGEVYGYAHYLQKIYTGRSSSCGTTSFVSTGPGYGSKIRMCTEHEASPFSYAC